MFVQDHSRKRNGLQCCFEKTALEQYYSDEAIKYENIKSLIVMKIPVSTNILEKST